MKIGDKHYFLLLTFFSQNECQFETCFYFETVTLYEYCSVEWGGIPINVIKNPIETIKLHRTFIFNLCIYYGAFPDSL